MEIWDVTLWAHLVGAAIWTGGAIAVVPIGAALMAGNVSTELMRRATVAWMSAAWFGMLLAVGTGIALTLHQDRIFTSSEMGLKLALVAAAAVVVVLDGWLLFRTPNWVRLALGSFAMIFNLGIFAAAVAL